MLLLIFIEFEASIDMDKALQDVKDKVSQKKSELPDDAGEPSVTKAESNTFSIITFSVSGNLPVYELSKTAEQIKSELEKITEISDIQIIKTNYCFAIPSTSSPCNIRR